ncbi:class I SAM-dependent methyltransferase [Actinomadura kijaniata]|uniref:SAM-dependent methyltransferase n=1 Tax=Actinomadura namibiensis TaxID=182080 RepID=A0A7W3QP69_ACTNM|nr:class I SAM-dependent methyltransferase [Actinomadura namibiensis]MBA8954296.1 SAM-dependent methyltransferase [Actinomadura namibiensis]
MTRVAARGVPSGEYWNHNTHYHPLLLAAMPRGCVQALDVGCGDGLLARRLARRAQWVTGVDRSPEVIARARRLSEGFDNVTFVAADFLGYEPPEDGFDFVCSVAALHHMDFAAGLSRMRDLLRPGGSLAVVGLARNGGLGDYVAGAPGLPAHYYHRLRRRGLVGGPDVPLTDPEMTWAEVREAAARLLPGAVFRRHVLWRYSLVWRKPR